MKNSKEKVPDRLVDSCKHSSINWMAAGSRLPRSSHGIFSTNFSNTPYSKCNIFVLEQAVGLGVLQTYSTCAVKQ